MNYIKSPIAQHPKKFWFLVIFIGVCIAASYIYPIGTLRYKMTILIDTPEGLKSGSAVREISMSSPIPRIMGRAGKAHLKKGEAVVIDLGDRGVLFTLMLGKNVDEDDGSMILDAFPRKDKRFTPENIRYYRSLKKAHTVLTPDLYPSFVHFKNLRDPKTVEMVEVIPVENKSSSLTGKESSLADIYGEGVSLRGISIEVTQEPIVDEIVNWLPWLHDGQSYISADTFSSLSLYEMLKTTDFKRGW